MPIFQIFTNLPREKIPEDFVLNLTGVLAETLNRPRQLCGVHILTDQILQFGDRKESFVIGSILSIGRLGEEENIKHSNALISEFEKIGVPPTNVIFHFNEVKSYEVASNKTTFKQILNE